jgi:hypothetical protein
MPLSALLDVSNKTHFALTTNNFLVCCYVSWSPNFPSAKVSSPTKKTKVNKDHPKPERKIGAWVIVWLIAFPVIFCPSLTCEGTKVLEVCRPTLAPSCDASQSVDAWID